MRNTIISYANLSQEVKAAFRYWLNDRTRDLISFPFKGKHMKGYIFNHENNNYLVVMQLQHEGPMSANYDDDEDFDILEEI